MTEDKKFLTIDDVEPYIHALNLSNYVWGIIAKWDYFSRKTIGAQFEDAVDSISANIAEGFGRYGKKDKIRFYQIAKGSLSESMDWNKKSNIRKLLKEDEFQYIDQELSKLPKEINILIKYTNIKLTIQPFNHTTI